MRLAAALLLSACATAPQPRVVQIDRPVRVEMPVRVLCVSADQIPAAPDVSPDDQIAAADDGPLVLMLARDRALLMDNDVQLRALLAGCTSREIQPTAETQ